MTLKKPLCLMVVMLLGLAAFLSAPLVGYAESSTFSSQMQAFYDKCQTKVKTKGYNDAQAKSYCQCYVNQSTPLMQKLQTNPPAPNSQAAYAAAQEMVAIQQRCATSITP